MKRKLSDPPKQIQYLITFWLIAVTLEMMLLPKALRPLNELAGIAQMSGIRILCVTAMGLIVWNLLPKHIAACKASRWAMVFAFAVYATSAVINSFTWAFFGACILVMLLLVSYALWGWDHSKPEPVVIEKEKIIYKIIVTVAAAAFFCIVSAWTVARVYSFSTPTYDFGIFSQMFHSMKETGLPMTTVERDKMLSHFAVHVSPIYYLMLPFYCLVPRPETLQVLQAAVLASAVIPLWLLGKRHGLHPGLQTLVCLLLLCYPSYAGGTSYDIHENCFLTPLILWLLYGVDKKNIPLTAAAAVLTLLVKEDAAVYVAVIALYLLLRSILHKEKWGICTGGALLAGSLLWFLLVTGYLAQNGDGVMNYRYSNFMYDGSNSLVTVIKSVLLCPMKAVFECVDGEKLEFIGYTMLPLLGLPLITRRYERLLLLIPYFLVNLMSDYRYQHDIMFQYTFGSTACLFYLVVVNLADLKISLRKFAVAGMAVCIAFGCFCERIVPTAQLYISFCGDYKAYYDTQRELLKTVPDDVSVAATTYYTTHLSNRAELYDIYYASKEHILDCNYVVIQVSDSFSFKKYQKHGKNGKENFVAMLLEEGYQLESEHPGIIEIYKKSP